MRLWKSYKLKSVAEGWRHVILFVLVAFDAKCNPVRRHFAPILLAWLLVSVIMSLIFHPYVSFVLYEVK